MKQQTKNVHGYELNDLEIMVFNKWCDNNNVSLNTLNPKQRTEVVAMWAKNIPEDDRPEQSPTPQEQPETKEPQLYTAASISRHSVVRYQNELYVLENSGHGKANLIPPHGSGNPGKEISRNTMLEVVLYPAQLAFEYLKNAQPPVQGDSLTDRLLDNPLQDDEDHENLVNAAYGVHGDIVQEPAAPLEGVGEKVNENLPTEIGLNWPRMNDDTVCMVIDDEDSGEIMVRLEETKNEDEKAFEQMFLTELINRYNAYPQLARENKELKELFHLSVIAAKELHSQNQQQAKDIADLLEALKLVSPIIDGLINRTPSGKQRNELTDINIQVKTILTKKGN